MIKNQFNRSLHDPCVYIERLKLENVIYLLLCVDDMLIAAKEKAEIERLKPIQKKKEIERLKR